MSGFVGMRADGIEAVIARLRNLAQTVPDNARKVMHRGADRIVREAKLNTPVDTHNLEESIHKEVDYGYRGRLKIDVVAGGEVNGVNVDQYAVIVHENYEGMLKNGPGPGTLAKMAANPGRIIGSKYLERALEAEREKLHRAMIAVLAGDDGDHYAD